MRFELHYLFLAGVLYLLLLFLIAYAVDRGWLPRRLASHPLTYVLSLGVYATSWSFYGSVGFAASEGYTFLTIYLGVTIAFIAAPILMQPILRLTREHHLASLADLFAFRYRSHLAGMLVTLFMIAGILPYIALQIRAVTESIQVLTQESTPAILALGFCLTLILFAMLFGARHISPREKHEGLVVAIAFESIMKLIAILAVGLFAMFGVFGGPGSMQEWLQAHPETLHALYAPVREGPWVSLLILAFAAAFLLPRQFHMIFTENLKPESLNVASWAFPLFLLLLNLAIPPILWAGMARELAMPADYYVLGVTLLSESGPLIVLAFIGGVSAASAMMIVTTLALSSMCMNYLVLPASFPYEGHLQGNLYRRLLWGRRLLIALIILSGYGFYLVLEHKQELAQLGLMSFVAVAQFLPGVIALLFWPRATRTGFIAGLLGGGTVWAVVLLLPLLEQSGLVVLGFNPYELIQVANEDRWSFSTFWSLTVNTALFVLGSLLTRPSSDEEQAASSIRREMVGTSQLPGSPSTATAYQDQLTRYLGPQVAEQEFGEAIRELRLTQGETRPTALRRLGELLERNLSGLIGPLLAHMVVNPRNPIDKQERSALAANVQFIEQRLEESRTQLRGLGAELDNLRRYHRQILQDLPLGVCALAPDLEVVSWNQMMADITGLAPQDIIGHPLARLPEPWSGLLDGFVRTGDRHMRKVQVGIAGKARWFNLHKAAIEAPAITVAGRGGTVILVEDLTELHTLEAELAHSERLASIGRLAAGVAHEIGNPVTGIASIAQNLEAEHEEALLKESIADILTQTQRITSIVQSLVSFSHSGMPERRAVRVRLYDCVDEAMRLVKLRKDAKHIQLANAVEPYCSVVGDHQRLVQVFVNLLTNACDASRAEGTVMIVAHTDVDAVHITVNDQGEGMTQDVLDQAFDPFFTTKQPGEGTGLGLPLVYNIVQDHAGSIYIDSESGIGTTVHIILPRRSQSLDDATTDMSEADEQHPDH